jgi:hypothetical protein
MALLGFGIWLVADQSSVITLLKLADHETIRVSFRVFIVFVLKIGQFLLFSFKYRNMDQTLL